MKTNFKKVFTQTAISAGLVAGSMAAQAVITPVPAPAHLIPLFGYTEHGRQSDEQGVEYDRDAVNTYVRVVVPKSVGLDDVIHHFSSNVAPNPPGANNQADVNPALLDKGTAKLHWYFLDQKSDHVANCDFPVTPDDAIEFSGKRMPKNSDDLRCVIPGNKWGYLLLVNESAVNGGEPLFAFAADAWMITDEDAGLPVPIAIPVLPLTDSTDPTGTNVPKVPSYLNNVVENSPNPNSPGFPASYPYGTGPIASPILSGIRVAVVGEDWVRALDIPMQEKKGERGWIDKYFVAWSSQNNGLSGRMWAYDEDERSQSIADLSLPYQLNFVHVGRDQHRYGPLGFRVTANVDPLISVDGGFLKWLLTAPVQAGPATGVYASAVIFTLPFEVFRGHTTEELAAMRGDNAAQNVPLFATDRGFFQNGGN